MKVSLSLHIHGVRTARAYLGVESSSIGAIVTGSSIAGGGVGTIDEFLERVVNTYVIGIQQYSDSGLAEISRTRCKSRS